MTSPDLEKLRIDRRGASRRRTGRAWWLAPVALAVVGMGVYALRPAPPAVELATLSAPAAGASAEPDAVLSAGGYIVAHHKINVNSKVTGRVAWIGVEKGDHVTEGQVLVRLEDDEFKAQVLQDKGALENAEAYLTELKNGSRPEEIAQAEHQYQQAEATLVNAQQQLARTRALAAAGIAPKSQLDSDQAAADAAVHQAAALEQALRLARIGTRQEEIDRAAGAVRQAQGALDYAQTELDATVIRAPVSGTILERTAEKGELITAEFASAADSGGPQGSVVTLADLSDLQVELDIAQNDFGRLHLHQRGIITTDAYPDRAYQGELTEISPEANRQKATVQVKVKVEKPDELLRPDMNATVKFLASPEAAAALPPGSVLAPLAALHGEGAEATVWIVSSGAVVARPVRIVGQRAAGSLITGVDAGAAVIVKAPDGVKPGDRVTVAAAKATR